MTRASKAPKPLRIEPLWARVDRNRVRLGIFVTAFVLGSAVLLALAFVAVPGSIIGMVVGTPEYFRGLVFAVPAAAGIFLLLGGFAAAVQLSNAEDWVRNRFVGSDLDPVAHPALVRAVEEMSLAGGLAVPPSLVVFEFVSVNACAIGTSRNCPVIGVTEGFLTDLDQDEQRAVVATLVARIARGDILVGTAMAALMGPMKAMRESRKAGGAVARGCADFDGCGGCDGCGDGCSGADLGEAGGLVVIVAFVALVIAATWIAALAAAWLVTAFGRALHRTGYEKADAEGMLLLKDPKPMLSALRKAISSATTVADGDPSYDGIFYASTSGTPKIEKVERRRYERLCEVLGTEGIAAEPLEGESA